MACKGFNCDVERGACETSCSSWNTPACTSGYTCKESTCARDCTGDSDCGGYRCIGRTCEVSCTDASECASGYTCKANRCAR
jgi:hypothetical protein